MRLNCAQLQLRKREREGARVRLSVAGDEKKENLVWEEEGKVKVAIILCALARDKIFAQEWHSVDKIRFENERMPGNEQRQRNCRRRERRRGTRTQSHRMVAKT